MIAALAVALAAASAPPLNQVAQLDQVPVGVAVSRQGRVFLAFSRAIDPDEPFSLAELVGGKPRAFPPGLAQEKGAPDAKRLLAVQALTVDARDRLWILDCAKVGQEAVQAGAPKLVAVELASGRVVKTLPFPAAVAGPTSFLNDLRVDLTQGREGVIYLTDASFEGPNGLVVVDLATGQSRRVLNDHPSTKPEPGFVANVEGQPLIMKGGKTPGQPFKAGADGIALEADGKHLVYAPLSGHHWYRVATDALLDPGAKDIQVEDLGARKFASDGLLEDAQGRIYLTDYEEGGIDVRGRDGKITELVKDPRLSWPDTLALAQDGTLYVTATQIHRGALARGKDERQRPFTLWSVKTDSTPLHRGARRPQARSVR